MVINRIRTHIDDNHSIKSDRNFFIAHNLLERVVEIYYLYTIPNTLNGQNKVK